MTTELRLLLLFEDNDWPPTAEEIEDALLCEVLDYEEREDD